MKKKIIFVTEALWIGGIETALINLLNRIDYDRYEVTVLVCRAELDLIDRVNPKCNLIVVDRDKVYSAEKSYRFGKLYHLTEDAENPSFAHKALMWTVPAVRFIENELYIRYVRSLMKKEKYDTAVIYSDRVAEIAARSIKADRYFLFYHNALLEKRYHDEIGYQKSEKVIAVSESKAEELRRFRPKYANKIIAIHNIVDLDSIKRKSEETQQIPFDKREFNLVTCGRLAHQKAIDWAIIACTQLVKRGYRNLQWWIVGGGPDEKKLQQQILDAGIEEHFHLLGMQNNPYPYIANCDLYVQPSRYENYSVVILEAMALYKPILATRPAADQQITSGVNGLLCEPEAGAVADAIDYLYNHHDEMEKYTDYLKDNTLEKANKEVMEQIYALI